MSKLANSSMCLSPFLIETRLTIAMTALRCSRHSRTPINMFAERNWESSNSIQQSPNDSIKILFVSLSILDSFRWSSSRNRG